MCSFGRCGKGALGCAFLLTLVVLPWGHGRAQEKAKEKKGKATTFRVLLPEDDAEILIDGKSVSTKGGLTREVTAPSLGKGKKAHEITATWWTNNYTMFLRTKAEAPKPGERVVVDLRKADPKNPDKIEIRFVPTPEDVVERMCKLAKIGKDDVIYDLGCGDGRMVIVAVADFKAKRGVGIDLDPERIKESKDNAKEYKVSDKIEFRVGDVLKVKDLSDASVVMLYMGEDVNARLAPIFRKTLKPGSRIVSHAFPIPEWKADKVDDFVSEDGDTYKIYLYTIKKK